jgi:hypothetical protein
MVYDTRNYCDFGLYPSSGILKRLQKQRFANWMFLSSGEVRHSTLLVPSQRANLIHCTNYVSVTTAI